MSKPKAKTDLEKKIFRVLINSSPVRSIDGMLKEIMRLIKENI